MLSTRKLRIPNFKSLTPGPTSDGELAQAFVVFHPNRGRLLSIVSDAPATEPTRDFRITGFPNSAQLVNEQLLSGGSATITSLGDPPEAVRWVLRRHGAKRFEVYIAHVDVCVGAAARLDFANFVELREQALVTPDAYAAGLAHTVAAATHPADVAAFVRMDGLTNPALATGGGLSDEVLVSVQRLRRLLERLLRQRAALEKQGDSASASDLIGEPSPGVVEAARWVSRALLHSLDMGDLSKSAMAIERFAAGMLRTELHLQLPDGTIEKQPGLWTTQPSSGAFFLFAEFAYLAIHCGIQTDTWLKLARAMTYSQHMFMACYRPALAKPRFEDWGACDFDATRALSAARADQLRNFHAELQLPSLRRQCARNALLAFPGSFT
jgi:hypothetical protein